MPTTKKSSVPVPSTNPSATSNRVFGDDAPLTVKQAAEQAGISLATMNRLIYSRQVASVKVAGRRKIRPSALRKYIAGNELSAI